MFYRSANYFLDARFVFLGGYKNICKLVSYIVPEAYSWPERRAGYIPTSDARRASETFEKWASKSASRPTHRSFREWSWTSELDCELELRDGGGDLLARLERNGGRYRLTHPRTVPILSWPDDGEDMAKHRAETIAVNSPPLRRAA